MTEASTPSHQDTPDRVADADFLRLTPGLQHRFATELPALCQRWQPARVPQPALLVLNHPLAHALGWPAGALDSAQGQALLSGNAVPTTWPAVAQVYAGHQFGGYSPQLGDGRALLLGEVCDTQGVLRDVAFKGSGRTPFSRGGDGKAALGPMLREYLISEAMHALGVPTTRSLAVVATGERIRRDSGWLPAAVLTRVAASHIRVGTFQWVAAQRNPALLRRLADHTLTRHYPALPAADYRGLLQAACERQAQLVAQWMALGFVHGVMNTDNMTLSGETIDYGPCAFMEAFDPGTVFSSIDHAGRYAWGRQPAIAQWNLARLAEALLPLIHPDADQAVALATETVQGFSDLYQQAWLAHMRAKLGWAAPPQTTASNDPQAEEDLALLHDWLALLHAQGADWTLAHRHLTELAAQAPAGQLLLQGWTDTAALKAWLVRWQARRSQQPATQAQTLATMRRSNPLYIPRNLLVEEALNAASDDGDLGPFEALLSVVQQPFDDVPSRQRYTQPADAAQAQTYRTFCGT
ncbi:MAG: hypothetical protein RLZZ352_1063 [Pseudomonadota bacterium]|jgi:uncharacterized protein YdiU (UPF0061 family)